MNPLQRNVSLGFKKGLARLSVVLCLSVGWLTEAHAVTECTVTPTQVFSGDDGSFWVFFSNGGSGMLAASDADFKQSFALATTALVTGKSLIIRYAANGVSCTATAQPFVGLFLLN